MARSYYGDKLSDNMIETKEGYLICQNVPIGRVGAMEYYGNELPKEFNEPAGKTFKVSRDPEELFSEATIGSFEGKPVTNTHPSDMLDINTVPMIERGHAQNVRREGDFLLADLFIKDAGLKNEIKNGLKREVSCGYDCSWVPTGDGNYEQREIIGNHVAIVKNGRAGPRVAIKDEKPKSGGKKMKVPTLKELIAAGFKHFAQDAEPEDIAKAMDAMKDEMAKEPEEKLANDKSAKDKAAKDEEMHSEKDEEKFFKELLTEIKSIGSRLDALEKKSSAKDEEPDKKEKSAADELSELEKEMTNEKPDKKEAKDEEAEKAKEEKEKEEEAKKPAADAALKKFVNDMKPIIMAIPDEKARLQAAKNLRSAVTDARSVDNGNGYADILKASMDYKKAAMDQATHQRESMEVRAQKSAEAWNAQGKSMRGDK